MCAHRVARRAADAADLEARQASNRRDDTREIRPRGEREKCGTSCTDERDCPEVIRGFIDEGNDNTESITNGVGFRNDISYGSIAPPVTYVLFAAFIVLMKAATVYAMRGLKQAK